MQTLPMIALRNDASTLLLCLQAGTPQDMVDVFDLEAVVIRIAAQVERVAREERPAAIQVATASARALRRFLETRPFNRAA